MSIGNRKSVYGKGSFKETASLPSTVAANLEKLATSVGEQPSPQVKVHKTPFEQFKFEFWVSLIDHWEPLPEEYAYQLCDERDQNEYTGMVTWSETISSLVGMHLWYKCKFIELEATEWIGHVDNAMEAYLTHQGHVAYWNRAIEDSVVEVIWKNIKHKLKCTN